MVRISPPLTKCINSEGKNDDSRNDILRKHGIIPEKPPSPTPIIEEAILEAQRRAHENRLEAKDLDELDALEDEEDEEFLEQYRCFILFFFFKWCWISSEIGYTC